MYTFATWLYVENGVGVAEKFLRRALDGETGTFITTPTGVRGAGVRNVRNNEVAIVLMSRYLQLTMPCQVRFALRVYKQFRFCVT
jgi:hypothetical protein